MSDEESGRIAENEVTWAVAEARDVQLVQEVDGGTLIYFRGREAPIRVESPMELVKKAVGMQVSMAHREHAALWGRVVLEVLMATGGITFQPGAEEEPENTLH